MKVNIATNPGEGYKVGFEDEKRYLIRTAPVDTLGEGRLNPAAVNDESVVLPYSKANHMIAIDTLADWLDRCHHACPPRKGDSDDNTHSDDGDDGDDGDESDGDGDGGSDRESDSDSDNDSDGDDGSDDGSKANVEGSTTSSAALQGTSTSEPAECRDNGSPTLVATCRPWVSYGSETSVTLNWLPPRPTETRFDRHQFQYKLFQYKVRESPLEQQSETRVPPLPAVSSTTSDSATRAGPSLPNTVDAAQVNIWQACEPPHNGHVYSHIVSNLTYGVRC